MWWWRKHATLGNFGDELGPFIVSRLLNIKIERTSIEDSDLISCGSVIHRIEHNKQFTGAVWGAGCIDEDVRLSRKVNILAVRGPYTLARISQATDVIGDPAILLPHIVNSSIKKHGKVGLVRHHEDMRELNEISDNIYDDINVNVESDDDIINVINRIRACGAIISSSLHGWLTAAVYDIPAMYLPFSNKGASIFKWHDAIFGMVHDRQKLRDSLINWHTSRT